MSSVSVSVVRADRQGLGLLFLGISALEGIVTLLWILSEPSDADVWRLLGYSLPRWGILLTTVFMTILFCFLFYAIPRVLSNETGRWYAGALRGLIPRRTELLLLLLLNIRLQMFLATLPHPSAGSIAARLMPVNALLVLFCLQMIIFLLLLRPPVIRFDLRPALAAWAAGIALGGVLLWTRFGLVKTTNGWYEYGVPLTHIQWFDLLLVGLVVTLISRWLGRTTLHSRPRPVWLKVGIEVLVAVGIWLVALSIWQPMPIPASWFSPTPMPPNQAIYPNSDASFYDASAQGILLGTEWARTTAHYKPLYVAFLTLAHAAVGTDYAAVIRLQTVFLALLPVLLYLIGRSLHSRLAGLLAAAALIMREYNQLLVGAQVTSSNSKLMLSELPTAIGICLLLLALILWLRRPNRRLALALLAGGIIAMVTQIRMQALVLLPAVIVLAALFYHRSWKTTLRTAGLLGLGFFLALAPLLARNALATGHFTIEKPGYMDRTLNYAFTSTTGEQYSQVSMMASGFVHNAVHSLLVLPSGYHGLKPWTYTTDLSGMFWISEALNLSFAEVFWLLLNLGLICLGAAAAWKRSRWAALLPAFGFGAYSLAGAVSGFSGQRFILPVDWVGYFYAVIGLVWLAETLMPASSAVVDSTPALQKEQPTARPQLLTGLAIAALLLVVGGLLPAVEAFFPVRYGSATQTGARERLIAMASSRLDARTLADFQAKLDQPQTLIFQGVALYPRESMNDAAPGSFIRTDPEVGSPFLSYLYQGKESFTVLQPTDGSTEVLPHAAEVILAGWMAEGRFHAFVTALPETGEVYFSEQLK